MAHRSVLLTLSAAILFTFTAGSTSRADTFSVTATSLPLSPSADSLTLTANTGTFTPGTPFTLQTGTYTVGDSGNLTGTFPYTFMENVTLDGVTEAVTFSASNLVTNSTMANTDFLTIFATSTFFPGLGLFLDTNQFTSPAFSVGGSSAVTLTATTSASAITTPEPAAWVLMATGLLGLFILRRRWSTGFNGPRS